MYTKQEENLLRDIVVNSKVTVHEGWSYDNWDGGIHGHAMTLTVSEPLFFEVMGMKEQTQDRICEDINKSNNVQNEHLDKVFIEMKPDGNDQWREMSGVLRPSTRRNDIPPNALTRVWGDGHVRIFLSHKVTFKKETSNLKRALNRCGIAAFVAHEDIEPTQEWAREIEHALFSMDALVALLTECYHDSDWTDQELGVAIGRNVLVIPVWLGRDPYGLVGKGQALRGCSWSEPAITATKIFDLLVRRLPDKRRLFEAALFSYENSISWADSDWKVENLLAKFEMLEPAQIERLIEVHRANPENKNSFAGMGKLKPLLEKWTGKHWIIEDNELEEAEVSVPMETPIPF